jgi:YVTN family beta-propeller protein
MFVISSEDKFYVANSNDDHVSVVDTNSDKVVGSIKGVKQALGGLSLRSCVGKAENNSNCCRVLGRRRFFSDGSSSRWCRKMVNVCLSQIETTAPCLSFRLHRGSLHSRIQVENLG